MAGLVRYEESAESKIRMEPKVVIFISIALLILEIMLFTFFPV
jgi:preprotein translocase subunit Sec61beta